MAKLFSSNFFFETCLVIWYLMPDWFFLTYNNVFTDYWKLVSVSVISTVLNVFLEFTLCYLDLIWTVYDVTRRETFTNLADIWAKEIDLYSTNQDCIKMLVGNKVDKVWSSVVCIGIREPRCRISSSFVTSKLCCWVKIFDLLDGDVSQPLPH